MPAQKHIHNTNNKKTTTASNSNQRKWIGKTLAFLKAQSVCIITKWLSIASKIIISLLFTQNAISLCVSTSYSFLFPLRSSFRARWFSFVKRHIKWLKKWHKRNQDKIGNCRGRDWRTGIALAHTYTHIKRIAPISCCQHFHNTAFHSHRVIQINFCI